MQSGHAATDFTPVLCSGVGARDGARYPLRLASFRLTPTDLSRGSLGIAAPHSAASTALVRLLSGRIAPAYGELHVLGYDMARPSARAAVRPQVGIAARTARTWPSITIRKLVERAARRSGQRGSDRGLLVAAILDRLTLTPWGDVQFHAAPPLVARRARLAAACVHEPDLLIIDGLFDQLGAGDRAALARAVSELKRDISIVALGSDTDAMMLFCDQLLTLADGRVIGPALLPAAAVHEVSQVPPFDHAR
jgi:ABC-2 type transport system ATP-binding protein